MTHAFSFFFADSDIKTEGFSLDTCRSMIALMDVSFNVCCCNLDCIKERLEFITFIFDVDPLKLL